MLRPPPHPFAFPTRRPPKHHLALAAVLIGLGLSVGVLVASARDALLTDEMLAGALPFALCGILLLLAGLLARLARDDA